MTEMGEKRILHRGEQHRFGFGHVKFGWLIRYPSRKVRQAFRHGIQGDTNWREGYSTYVVKPEDYMILKKKKKQKV